ncbi:fumarylacetoacetate hydrolase family protein [Ideonella sp. BN130291]|uniref:fumarylacetoacetate hydrolase family protein n=1 Tax=Ideonella sp. BN130291 TaxID=3112940 RepID=UPI002E26F78D|nr:fumarylacetoacetate hydrolase family protein [Ideonella sp. BN130291]
MTYVVSPPAMPGVPVAGGGTFPVRRIYCVGRNYVEHAIEMGHTGREPPFFFLKPADSILPVAEGEVGEMAYPSLTKSLHHEVELVVAIGQGGRDIPVDQAMAHVWGYAVGLDMTRRDLQNEMKKQGRPWDIGKGFDQAAPIGALKPAAQCQVGADTRIALRVNGEPRQGSVICKLIWSLPEVISHLSAAWELQPGDLIYSGTPEGVAAVQAGDLLEAEVDGLPRLAVRIV